MDAVDNLLAIDYLGIVETAEINLIIRDRVNRLKQACRQIEACKMRVANIARRTVGEQSHAYLVSISLYLSDGTPLYTLRSPLPQKDSIEVAIADVFAKIYRQLIELQIEEKYLLAV